MADNFSPTVAPVDDVTKFESTLNTNWHDADYNARLGAARTLVGGAIATVADFGASVWNSLPATPEVETQDLLQRVSNDALQVYNEDPDVIHAASFIGGSLLPFGMATKGMGLARAGVKGANWFSAAGKAENIARLNTLFEEGGAATSAYKATLREVYAKGFINQALDAAAGEVAVMGMMNAHPLMEDYMKDPVKNFAIGIGLGSALGGAIGLIADRHVIRSGLGAIEEAALGKSLGVMRDIHPDMTGAVALQSHDVNIENLTALLDAGKALGKDETNDLAMKLAGEIRTKSRNDLNATFQAMAKNDATISAMTVPEQEAFRDYIASKREMVGVDEVSLFKPSAAEKSPLDLPAAKISVTETKTVTPAIPQVSSADLDILQNELFNMKTGTNSPLENALKVVINFDHVSPTEQNVLIHQMKSAGRQDVVDALIHKAMNEQAYGKNFLQVDSLANFKLQGGHHPDEWQKVLDMHLAPTTTTVTTTQKVKGASPLLTDKPVLTQNKLDKSGNVIVKDVKSVYYPEFDRYGKERDVINYGNATVLGKTVKELEKDLPSNYGKIPNLEASLEFMSKSAPKLHGEFIAARARAESWDAEELAKRVLGSNDLPLMSAILQRLRGDFDLQKNVKIKLADKSPMFKAIEAEHAATAGLNKAGVPQSYHDAVMEFTQPGAKGIERFDPKNFGNIDSYGKDILFKWLAGDQNALNRAALAYNGKGFSAVKGGGATEDEIDAYIKQIAAEPNATLRKAKQKALDEVMVANAQIKGKKSFDLIYNSPESQALRDKFKTVADADGYVLLYRGQTRKSEDIRHQNILQSFTTDPQKAEEFTGRFSGKGAGDVRLQKVHVDNIVAGWGDLKSHDGLKKNEILVMAGERPIEAVLSEAGVATFKKKQVIITGGIKSNDKELAYGDLQDLFISEKQRQMDEMFAQGIPPETISLKTDTPLATVLSYGAGKNGGAVSLEQMINGDLDALIKTKTVTDAEQALAIKNTPLRLEGNQLKNNGYGEGHAALANKNMTDISNTATEAYMNSSKNQTVLELGRFVHEEMKDALAIAKQQLYLANNQLSGLKFLQSTDFFTRNMGSLGPTFAAVGRQIQRLNNDMIGRVVSPVKDALTLISKDASGASTLEFNTFFNVNASLKGWRQFMPDGTLVQKVMKTDALGKQVQVLEPVTLNGKAYKVVTPEVQKAIMAMQQQGGELLSLRNAGRKIKGQPDTSDIGLYIPSMNPVGKHIAYVHDMRDDTTRMIWANNETQYNDAVKAYKEHIKQSGQEGNVRVYEKGAQQKEWSDMNGRLDTLNMERADVGLQKTGSGSSALVRTDTNIFSEITGGYEHYITKNIRDLAELNMHEITGMLDNMSVLNQGSFPAQPMTAVQRAIKAPKDTAATMKNTLLGNSNLGEYGGWKVVNQSFENLMSYGSDIVAGVWKTAVAPFTNAFSHGLNAEQMRKVDYEKLSTELTKRGIVNPFEVFDQEAAKMFGLASITDSKDISKRVVYASNALVATMALRVGELAQPLVNMLSLPILTGLAINSKMPAEFLGKKLGLADLGPLGGVQIMHEGMRAMNSPLYRNLSKQWEAAGHYSPLVSEASEVARLSRSFEKGAITKIENALDSSFVKIMSKPADLSESFVRKYTMHTGAVLAKRLYPELDDAGITIFARDFMDKAVGNFSASQRPVFFQGTLGTALGLFQTYMLTLGQSIYRQLEMRNYKALGKAALTQSTIFGAESLPGFQQVSQMIGEHFSDDNVDLTTGTFRAVGDKAANFILYGLPSNLGPSVYTRGDVSIRPPNVLAGMQNTVAVSAASQMMDMLGTFKNAMEQDSSSMGRAFGEALSMQSMSRPIARGAELATGYSVTRKGNTVQVPEEVWTTTGIMSRVLGTRPLEESKLREAMHLNTFYGSVDRDNREKLLSRYKTMIRSGDVNDEEAAKISNDYLRHGGTPTGWRSAQAKAIAHTEEDGTGPLLEKLGPRSPLHYMIHNLD